MGTIAVGRGLTGLALKVCAALAILVISPQLTAAPADVAGISRTQSRTPGIVADQTLRIWLIGVGQGDAILIELPKNVSMALGNPANDPVNILVDGGATPVDLAKRTPEFLHRLYGADPTIEHMVLTHHDRDHVVGLTKVLQDTHIGVSRVYVSGLAAFRRGVRDIPMSGNAGGFIGDDNRSLGRFTSTGLLDARYLVDTLGVLKARVTAGELTSDYGAFAGAVVGKTQPAAVQSFRQACFGCAALDEIRLAAAGPRPALAITTVWPQKRPRAYASNWGKTTNGNSVAFRLDYGDFSILLTGDLNEESEPDLIAMLEDESRLALLDVDIFKAAHHGSKHNAPEFLEHDSLKPVVSAASMGSYGFMESNYKHPDQGIIGTLGGPKRFFSTFIHERKFDRATMKKADYQAMVEDTHVLIESDGKRFRIVEVSRLHDSTIPEMSDVSTGNGTPWISAN